MSDFKYIKKYYGVNADMYREVVVDGKKGVIAEDMGTYIGVYFYDKLTEDPMPCHPTWKVEYLDSFNHKPPFIKLSRSQKRYRDFKSADMGISFKEYLGITSKAK